MKTRERMNDMSNETAASLGRWRVARRLTLTAIVLSGAMATAAAATYVVPNGGCPHARKATTGYTYPGIGVELEQRGEHFVVRRVFDGTPADGQVFEGAVLISADGQSPDTMSGWTSIIRGPEGTEVELELAYHCRGHETVTLERDLIHLDY